MSTFQGFLKKNNNVREMEVQRPCKGRKVNSEAKTKQKWLIFRANQKVSIGKKEHLAFKACKS